MDDIDQVADFVAFELIVWPPHQCSDQKLTIAQVLCDQTVRIRAKTFQRAWVIGGISRIEPATISHVGRENGLSLDDGQSRPREVATKRCRHGVQRGEYPLQCGGAKYSMTRRPIVLE